MVKSSVSESVMPTPREVTESLCCNLRDRKSNIATANVATLLNSWAITEILSRLIVTFNMNEYFGDTISRPKFEQRIGPRNIGRASDWNGVSLPPVWLIADLEEASSPVCPVPVDSCLLLGVQVADLAVNDLKPGRYWLLILMPHRSGHERDCSCSCGAALESDGGIKSIDMSMVWNIGFKQIFTWYRR